MRNPSPSKDTTIPVGSVVKVTDSGQGYSTYAAMAEYMGLDNWGDSHRPSRYPIQDDFYHVVAKAVHESEHYGEVLGLQREDGHQCIIGIKGVTLVSAPVVSLSAQVAEIEQKLADVTKERDELKAQIAAVRNLFTAQ